MCIVSKETCWINLTITVKGLLQCSYLQRLLILKKITPARLACLCFNLVRIQSIFLLKMLSALFAAKKTSEQAFSSSIISESLTFFPSGKPEEFEELLLFLRFAVLVTEFFPMKVRKNSYIIWFPHVTTGSLKLYQRVLLAISKVYTIFVTIKWSLVKLP